MLAQVRTSSGMFFERGEDEVIARVERRVAALTMLPAINAEGMQVLHYQVCGARGRAVAARHLGMHALAQRVHVALSPACECKTPSKHSPCCTPTPAAARRSLP